jgi:pyruvate/2-oxoglutarate dehydrogenase complex dihydrolipoamide dehydrogenase (E3) component
MTQTFDALIVGAGQAGPPLAGRLADAGMKVALVERKLFGGTCVNTGCTPTKTLVASAHAAYLARRSADYGVGLGGAVTVDMKKVKIRQDAVVREYREGVEAWLTSMHNCTVYRGHARFESSHRVRVNDE